MGEEKNREPFSSWRTNSWKKLQAARVSSAGIKGKAIIETTAMTAEKVGLHVISRTNAANAKARILHQLITDDNNLKIKLDDHDSVWRRKTPFALQTGFCFAGGRNPSAERKRLTAEEATPSWRRTAANRFVKNPPREFSRGGRKIFFAAEH